MPGFHHSVAVLPLVDNQSAFWSLHPYVYGKTFPAFPFSPATAMVATERKNGNGTTARHNGTTERRNGNGRMATEWWKLGISHAAFNYSIPEVGTGKSRSSTSDILLRSVDTRNYATENCVWQMPISTHNIREFWGQNFYRHSANLILLWLFLRFLKRHFKKRNKSCFCWNLKKT